jgi:2-keto-4-pentenoate hydratase/2-oxohepta-3-ene-1,7-dioic acid hydratase in catechol pathway
MTRREVMLGSVAVLAADPPAGVTNYVRFDVSGRVAYGILEGDRIRELRGDLFAERRPSGRTHALKAVRLLFPCEPPKVFAVGLNYKSHLGNTPAPVRPEIFYKPVTCLQHPGGPIVIPAGARNVHFEGELVIVIGKTLQRASKDEARAGILGYTCGNDVSERDWQNGPAKDLQWWRAKGADTFGPMGPVIAAGLDPAKLLLQTRVNGEVKQKQFTSDLLFDCPTIVSFISQYVTLAAGDVIFTGTPGQTSALSAGDTVEIEIEGIGVLKNPVRAA